MIRVCMAAAFLAALLFAENLHATAFYRLERHGRVIEYALVLPDHFEKTKPYPVLLALPPGNQTKELVEAGLRLYWEAEAIKRGWVIISPAAPPGTSFYTGAEKDLPHLLDEVSQTVTFEGGKAHLAGVSNGGLSAYRVITEYPERFLSLTVLPGIPPDDRAFDALGRLKGIPVAAFVGGEDSGWVRGSQAARQKLDALGIENTLKIVPGESHVIALNPAKLFDLLDTRRRESAAKEANERYEASKHPNPTGQSLARDSPQHKNAQVLEPHGTQRLERRTNIWALFKRAAAAINHDIGRTRNTLCPFLQVI